MRYCVMGGLDREIVTRVQRVRSQVNSFVEMFLRVGEFIRNDGVLNIRLANHEDPEVDSRKHNRPMCKKMAAISLDDIIGAKRHIILHQRGGGLQRKAIDAMLMILCNSLCCSHVMNQAGIQHFGIKVKPQTIKQKILTSWGFRVQTLHQGH